MSASVLIWMISSFKWEIWFKVILFYLKSSGMYGICEYFLLDNVRILVCYDDNHIIGLI